MEKFLHFGNDTLKLFPLHLSICVLLTVNKIASLVTKREAKTNLENHFDIIFLQSEVISQMY